MKKQSNTPITQPETSEKQVVKKPRLKAIKLNDFYKGIGVVKLYKMKFAGGFRDYSSYMSDYINVFFDIEIEKRSHIKQNKIISYSWKLKEGYEYELGFSEFGEMLSLRNKDSFLCYFVKPNKIYFVNFKKKTREFVNRPVGAKHPTTEPFKIKL